MFPSKNNKYASRAMYLLLYNILQKKITIFNNPDNSSLVSGYWLLGWWCSIRSESYIDFT